VAEKARDQQRGLRFSSQVVVDFIDVLTDDSKEDSFQVSCLIQAGVIEYKLRCARAGIIITSMVLLTDGAGCFAGTEFAAAVGDFGRTTGISVSLHIVTEAGCGKSFLDAHFPFAMAHCSNVVRHGRGTSDIECAKDCAAALSELGGLANSVSIYVDVRRALDYGEISSFDTLDSYSQRAYQCDAAGNWTSMELSRFPLYKKSDSPLDGLGLGGALGYDLLVTRPNFLICFPNGLVPVYNTASSSVMPVNKTLRKRREHPLQLALTKADMNRKQELHNAAKHSRQEAHAARVEADEQHQAAVREKSSLFHCEVPGCGYFCKGRKTFDKHVELSIEEHTSRRITETDNDTILRSCVASTSAVKFCASQRSITDGDRTDGEIYSATDTYFGDLPLIDGTAFCIKESRPPLSFAQKTNATQVKMTLATWDFVLFCQGRGDPAVDGGTKTLPHQAAKAMRWLGTARGAEILTQTAHDIEYMTPSPTNTRSFLMGELKDAQQLKGYFSKPRTELLASKQRLVARLASLEQQASDPVWARIASLARTELTKKYASIMTIKSEEERALVPPEIVAGFTAVGGEALAPKDLKPLMLALLDHGGRAERDLAKLRKRPPAVNAF